MFNEINKEKLSQKLTELETYKAPESCWDRIVNKLDNEALDIYPERISQALTNLPAHHAPGKIWTGIIQELDHKNDQLNMMPAFRKLLLWTTSAAAAILVLAYFIHFRNQEIPFKAQESSIEFSVEHNEQSTISTNYDEAAAKALNLISERCQVNRQLCNNSDFRTLRSTLDEVTVEEQKIQEMLDKHGEDEELKIKLVRLEREKSNILKKLISLS